MDKLVVEVENVEFKTLFCISSVNNNHYWGRAILF